MPRSIGGGQRHILVVDDEPHIREVVQYALQREGFVVHTAKDASEADVLLEKQSIDLMVLDIMLPDKNGLDLCREVRRRLRVPILFLSARGEEVDRIVGLEMGADDYLSKPFGTRELVARIRAILRRTDSASESPKTEDVTARLVHGALALDAERHEVRVNDHAISLTHTEFCLLFALMRRPEIVFERAQLLREARQDDTHITERTVDTHIRRIRAKLREHGLAPIATVHGVGYKLSVDACSLQ